MLNTSKSSVSSDLKSSSVSSSSSAVTVDLAQKRLWRAIDILNVIVMIFSLYTGIIVAILRNELFEQCPLYTLLQLRVNATQFALEAIDQQTKWGSVYSCEFASFTYLSSFVLGFISLWIHFSFRRILRTERLLRLPIGVLISFIALTSIVTTSVVTDGTIKFCLQSPYSLCSAASPAIFRSLRWKIISLPVGGWCTTLSLIFHATARIFQLLSKPKKSPETVRTLLHQMMIHRQQQRHDRDGSELSSPYRTQSHRRHSIERLPEPYPPYHPPIPQYRQIKQRSWFQRFCCPCLRRRRRRQQPKPSFHQSFPPQPYVIPEEYFHRLNQLKETPTTTTPVNYCQHQQTQTDSPTEMKDENQEENASELAFVGRRRSSVRFEDELPIQPPVSPKVEPPPIAKKEETKGESPGLERNVSFRNNEDDLWTTITINSEQLAPIQSSHYNRITFENLSRVNTSITNNDQGVTAIQINSTPTEPSEFEKNEYESSSANLSSPPPPPPPPPPMPSSSKPAKHRPSTRHKPPPPPPSRCMTTSSEEDAVVRRIKPVEEINTLVENKYSYDDLSQALKSNVQRLKSTFIQTQDVHSTYDTPANLRSTDSEHRSSNC